jgi:hypothetical protein
MAVLLAVADKVIEKPLPVEVVVTIVTARGCDLTVRAAINRIKE